MEWMKSNCISIRTLEDLNCTPLLVATQTQQVDIVLDLIRAGADVNFSGTNTSTPLILASHNGYQNIVKILIDNNVDLNKMGQMIFSDKTRTKTTALIQATHTGNECIVEELLNAGADVNTVRTPDGVSPLQIASSMNNPSIVLKLIKAGANLDQANMDGITALMIASNRGFVSIVNILLQYGANLYTQNNNGGTAFTMSAEYPEVLNLLYDFS